ncbi:MAG: serine--tRNA ligase [Candidatus Hodarchaeales archaeon]
MLDIIIFREKPEIIKESEKKRFKDPNMVDKVIELDKLWRDVKKTVDDLRKERNALSKEIGRLKKEKKKEEASVIQEKVRNLNVDIKSKEDDVGRLLKERDELRYTIGNILHDSVPIAKEEEGNKINRSWGNPIKATYHKGHADLVEILDVAEITKAAEVAGSRTYYLKKDLVFLNLALIQYALQYLVDEKKYVPLWTPYFLRKEVMRGASELGDLEEQLYQDHNEDIYFIATSEQPLAALHMNDLIEENDLPIRYCGFSTNFRREAGAHGRDTKGIFRVHQFDKVEQFIFAHPDNSWEFHEELILNAEHLFKNLKLPYRIANIASGELNDNAAKKYDLEVWFPTQNTYREMVSCSNCTDYQARKLNVRMGRVGTEKKKDVVHTLNSTAIATERTICAILENFQEEDGSVPIPKVLHPYMAGRTVIQKLKK